MPLAKSIRDQRLDREAEELAWPVAKESLGVDVGKQDRAVMADSHDGVGHRVERDEL